MTVIGPGKLRSGPASEYEKMSTNGFQNEIEFLQNGERCVEMEAESVQYGQ